MPDGRYPRKQRLTGGRLGVIALAATAACTVSPAREPNVLLILVDTLRADHLGSYGYTRDTSPNIDNLGADGVLIKNVVAQASATHPSVAALLTSRYGSRFYERSSDAAIPEQETTLAEVLREHGYRTAAFSSNPLVSDRTDRMGLGGFEQGFDLFDDSVAYGDGDEDWDWQWRSPSGIVTKAIEWLEALSPDRKFFLYLHIMDPHDVYWAPEPFRRLYHDGYEGRKQPIAKGNATVHEHRILNGKKVNLARRDIEHLIALYDAEITYVDSTIQRLLDNLDSSGRLKTTLVVITSDHGEEFFEHGGLKHGYTLYREAIEVPWLMRYPSGLPSGTVMDDGVVQLIDMAPTILDLVGIPIPPEMEGASLVSRLRRQHRSAPDTYAVSETPYSGAKAIVTDTWKYVFHTGKPWRQGLPERYAEGTELYNLRDDPDELRDCLAENEDIASQLHQLLLQTLREDAQDQIGGSGELDAEAREKLRALGYLEQSGE